jgi:hypothetical protein
MPEQPAEDPAKVHFAPSWRSASTRATARRRESRQASRPRVEQNRAQGRRFLKAVPQAAQDDASHARARRRSRLRNASNAWKSAFLGLRRERLEPLAAKAVRRKSVFNPGRIRINGGSSPDSARKVTTNRSRSGITPLPRGGHGEIS